MAGRPDEARGFVGRCCRETVPNVYREPRQFDHH